MIPIPQEILQVFRFSMVPFIAREVLSLPLIDLDQLDKPLAPVPKNLHFLHPEDKCLHFAHVDYFMHVSHELGDMIHDPSISRYR
jgi:hypothetical protein